jgi:FtsH-binding integral membrane protein
MNWPHVHLVLNHIPVIGTGFVIMLFLAAWRMKSRDVTTVALVGCILVALCTVPVFLTGEPAADAVKGMAHVTDDLIHAHEEAAVPAFVAILIAGALSGLALWNFRRRGSAHKWLLATLIVVLLVTAGLMVRAANLGGRVQHQEIRAGAPADGVGGAKTE